MAQFKKQTIYQIYLKSFYDSDGDGRGDIKGVTQKLEYFTYLGVDMLWLSPFYISPQNDNGYDVQDYYAIDPLYGTMADFEELCSEAKKRNIGIMLDMVFNHTSTKNVWFQKALNGEKKYKDYYIFRKGKKDGTSPTNWVSKFGGNAWQYVEKFDEYYLHLFDKTQADLNWDNPEVREEIAKVVRYWMDKGAKGFRFDVINLISKPEIFEDDYIGDGRRFYTDGPHVHEYLKELNVRSFGMDENCVTVGEMSSTTIENCVKYAGSNEQELSSVFNFHHLKVDYKNKQKWNTMPFNFMELKKLLFDWQIGMQESDAWNAMFWCNHDQPRSISRFGDDKNYPNESAKMLATSIHMMRGTPYIFQGEEIGMTNAYFDQLDKYRDVESLNYYTILKEKGYNQKEIFDVLQARSRDNARTPMQWDATDNAGFSDAKTSWIDVVDNYKKINVEANKKNPDSILQHYRQLIQLRKDYQVIREGLFESLLIEHDSVLAYKRKYQNEEILVITNFYGNTTKIHIEDIVGYTVLLSNYPEVRLQNTVELKPYEATVYYRQVKESENM